MRGRGNQSSHAHIMEGIPILLTAYEHVAEALLVSRKLFAPLACRIMS